MNSLLTRLSYQNKIILSGLLFALIAIGLIYLLILPGISSVEEIKIQTENQSQQAEKSYQQGKNLKNLTANIKTVEPRVAELEQIFINRNDSLSFATSLETAAAKNKVTEKANLGKEIPLDQQYSLIPLQLTINGDFPGLIGFISDLENFTKYINFNNLTLQISSTNASESGIKASTEAAVKPLSAQISASTYWKN
jgi:Tfp pilus assembly protein PilO